MYRADLQKMRKERFHIKMTLMKKNIFFHEIKNFPQINENTREILENMSEII